MKHILLIIAALLANPAIAAPQKPVIFKNGVVQDIPAGDVLTSPAPSTAAPSINLPAGTAPSSPADGDIGRTSSGIFERRGGVKVGPLGPGGASTSNANTWGGYQTFGTGTSTALDVSSANNTTQCLRNASASSVGAANEYCGFFSVRIPAGHGSSIPYEVAAIFTRCVTADSSPISIDLPYDCVGGEFQGITEGTGQFNRIWGVSSTVQMKPGTDGIGTGFEVNIINNGTTGGIQSPKAKYGYVAVCRTGTNCTGGYNLQSDTVAIWQYGFQGTKQDVIAGGCMYCVLDASVAGLPALSAMYADGHTLTHASSYINGPAATSRYLNYSTGANASAVWLRWSAGANGAAESGANAGSDYNICSYSDTAVSLGCPLVIQRSSGVVFMGAASLTGGIAIAGAATAASMKLTPVAVASLPTCNSGAEGTLYAVNNANSAVFNAVIAGGGTNHVMAYCNGTGWTVH